MMMYSRDEAKLAVGLGWSSLIDELFDRFPTVELIDVKEKYGTLHLYPSFPTDDLTQLIESLEARSSKLCEVCGKDGELKFKKGWWRTACFEH